MSEIEAENNSLGWSSTYSLITIERILGRYNIRVSQDDLQKAVKNPNTIYYRLVEIPMHNVFNGIICQQAKDYQSYAQKLYVDYLLSGETGKSEEAPGGLTRTDLEKERQLLLKMSEEFQELEYRQEKLIADSQRLLINDADNWLKFFKKFTKNIKSQLQSQGIYKEENQVENALIALLIEYDAGDESSLSPNSNGWSEIEQRLGQTLSQEQRIFLKKELSEVEQFIVKLTSSIDPYIDEVTTLGMEFKRWRSDFYNFIIHANDLIKLLPEYNYDPIQAQLNLDAIRFDSDI